ncbi:MAG: hypothetical protein H6Q68_897 [Firmicutes bacterium]|nr:hypothetical protein [Bacillota bacterium]
MGNIYIERDLKARRIKTFLYSGKVCIFHKKCYNNINGSGWGLVASAVFKTVCVGLTVDGWVRFLHAPAMRNKKLLRCLPQELFYYAIRIYNTFGGLRWCHVINAYLPLIM